MLSAALFSRSFQFRVTTFESSCGDQRRASLDRNEGNGPLGNSCCMQCCAAEEEQLEAWSSRGALLRLECTSVSLSAALTGCSFPFAGKSHRKPGFSLGSESVTESSLRYRQCHPEECGENPIRRTSCLSRVLHRAEIRSHRK